MIKQTIDPETRRLVRQGLIDDPVTRATAIAALAQVQAIDH